jgi:hypothetical protein
VRKEPSKYAIISKAFLSDTRLSFREKGVLAYLLSKPDDWQVIELDLIRQGTDGREAIRSGMRELTDAGYVRRYRRINRRTRRMEGVETVVYETPELSKDAADLEATLTATFSPWFPRRRRRGLAPQPHSPATTPQAGFPSVEFCANPPSTGFPATAVPNDGKAAATKNEATKNESNSCCENVTPQPAAPSHKTSDSRRKGDLNPESACQEVIPVLVRKWGFS